MSIDIDRVVHWLVARLELETSVFHVGQYCGSWRASTAGQARASFHLVLGGQCRFQVEGQAALDLGPHDAVFLLRDVPHRLTSSTHAQESCEPRPMLPLRPALPQGTSLACGFFEFRGALGDLLVNAFPDYLVLRAGNPALASVAPLFDLILAEATRSESSSPLIERLTELLFFYVLRDAAQRQEVAAGLLAVMRRPQFLPLIGSLLRTPGDPWAIEDMARVAHMSRASFFKHFIDACGLSPAQFLLSLRMNVAAQRLREGESVTRAAEHVGYQSQAAFTRAFKKVFGTQPGAYQRQRQQTVLAPPLSTSFAV